MGYLYMREEWVRIEIKENKAVIFLFKNLPGKEDIFLIELGESIERRKISAATSGSTHWLVVRGYLSEEPPVMGLYTR